MFIGEILGIKKKFRKLKDTPNDYISQAGKIPKVKSGEDGLEFTTISEEGYTSGPASNTDNNIPQWDGADANTLKDGLGLQTSVGSPGVDTNLVSEQGIREALNAVEQKKIKATFFATISSGTTTGTITKPASAGADVDFIMDEWGISTDALLSTISDGKPTFISPIDASGNIITTTFNTSGAYTFSATPSPAADHALIYVYTCYLKNFDVAESLFEAELSLENSTPTFAGIVVADGGTIGQAAGPLLNFDDSNNYLGIAGCKVGIGMTEPGAKLEIGGTIRITVGDGVAALNKDMKGIELNTGVMNIVADYHYGCAIKFTSYDSDFTTENPKFLAGIIPRATENYYTDAASGMAIDFATSPNDVGATNIPVVRMTIDNNGNIGAGTMLPDQILHAEKTSALTNIVQQILRLTHITSGTPANNIGVGIEFEQETAADNNEIIATIEAIVDDVTLTGEDAAISLKTMVAGAAATEALRVDSNVTAAETRLLIYDVDNATVERVSVGAADSGGAGFKVLRIPN